MDADDRVRLQHMIDAGEAIAGFVSGRTRADIEADRMLLYAVVRGVEVMGEAAARLTESVRSEAHGVPWSAIVSMRNRLVHGYFDIDPDIVWKTSTEEIPALLPILRRLLAEAEPRPETDATG
jgi:uncharacterized protein with HEPN domain